MATTYDRGDVILVDKLTTRTGPPVRREIVSFTSPEDGKLTLKRVVGVAGNRVAIRDGYLFVNDEKVSESFVDHASMDATYFGSVMGFPQSVFVMGDNRANSIDSRSYGAVPIGAINGRARFRLWS